MSCAFTDIFIITYGRTGSTLLQALLNTVPGFDIEGENFGFLYHLYAGLRALRLSRHQMQQDKADTPSHPFFGASRAYRHDIEAQVVQTAKAFLRRGTGQATVCGFKEVRHDIPDLPDYLAFLTHISERPHFIFLTRNHQDVIASGFMREADPSQLVPRLQALERDFASFAAGHPEITTELDYADITGPGPKFAALLARLGQTYDAGRIAAVMAQQHSYAGRSTLVFMGHRLQVAPRAALESPFEVCRLEPPNVAADGTVTITGLLLPRAGHLLESLSAGVEGAAHQAEGTLNLPSPGLSKQRPDDGRAARARFSVMLPEPGKVQTLSVIINGSRIVLATFFPAPQLPQSRLFEPVSQTGVL